MPRAPTVARVPLAAAVFPRGERTEGEGAGEAERALVERAKAGDRRAFRRLYETYAGPVYRFALLPAVRDRTLAEDLLADTFMRALEHLPRFQWQGKGLLPWLLRIAKNLAFDHLRRRGRVVDVPADELPLADGADPGAEVLLGRSEAADVQSERIAACMAVIHPRYRRVLELRLVEGLAREEAAVRLEVTLGTLDVLLFRACRAFRRAYAERWPAESAVAP